MRVLAIGDIHGCSRALDVLLEAVCPSRDDLLVALGDYVDWGPDSRGVLERLINLSKGLRLIALRGNHEEMMLRARSDPNERALWLNVGGGETERSYGGNVPQAHWTFLETQCVDFFETDSHIFVHGGVEPGLPLVQQPVAGLRWRTFRTPQPHCSGKVVVCGHTVQRNGWPAHLGHSACIDTGAAQGGWLTCLDVNNVAFWQSNQRGDLRRGELTSASGSRSGARPAATSE